MRRWLYLANARVPSEKAHVFQIFQMVDAFHRQGVVVEVAYPARANLDAMRDVDPVQLYGLSRRPALRALPTLDAVRLVTIDAPRLNRPPLPALAFAMQSCSFAVAAALHARRAAADVIYSRDWPVLAAAAALSPRAPLVWEAHDLPQGSAARQALRRLLPRLAGVVAISRGLGVELADMGLGPARLLVAADAVDLARFASLPSREAARAALGLPAGARIVTYTGHLYAWKGAHTLALASRDLAEGTVVCIVGGTPVDLDGFRAYLRRERLDKVRLAGYVPPAQVPCWLAAADALALPNSGKETISARYTSPLKLFEYMAAGRPIVASDLPSLREVLVHAENAYLVPPDDPAALARGIRAVLEDPSLGDRLGRAALSAVQGRTWDARAAAIVSFVDRAAGR